MEEVAVVLGVSAEEEPVRHPRLEQLMAALRCVEFRPPCEQDRVDGRAIC